MFRILCEGLVRTEAQLLDHAVMEKGAFILFLLFITLMLHCVCIIILMMVND